MTWIAVIVSVALGFYWFYKNALNSLEPRYVEAELVDDSEIEQGLDDELEVDEWVEAEIIGEKKENA
jgi:Na+/H+ antiporter NhaB